jgi:hypothetical protein
VMATIEMGTIEMGTSWRFYSRRVAVKVYQLFDGQLIDIDFHYFLSEARDA